MSTEEKILAAREECLELIRKVFNRMIDAAPVNTLCKFQGREGEPCQKCGKSFHSPYHQAPIFDPRTPR